MRPEKTFFKEDNMDIYNTVKQLADEIRVTQEYVEYKEMKKQIKDKPELKEKLEKKKKARYETQLATMKGEEPKQEQIRQLQEIYMDLIENDITKKYLDIELKFNMMIGNINDILRGAVQDVIE